MIDDHRKRGSLPGLLLETTLVTGLLYNPTSGHELSNARTGEIALSTPYAVFPMRLLRPPVCGPAAGVVGIVAMTWSGTSNGTAVGRRADPE